MKFAWDPDFRRCRATAVDANDALLGEVTVEIPDETRRKIWNTAGGGARFRIEELAEKHLRTMLDLRY